ncbi:hypothetical protein IJ818_06815 [bacterium]|nr:hypothetical protein [bacterium]
MNFRKYRKYFFINLSALWSFIVIYSIIVYSNTDYPPPAPNDVIAIGGGEFFIMALCIIILLWLFGFTILEILIRKYLIEKKFPNFKLNLKIKMPKFIVAIYNVIFSIGFLLASFLFFVAIVLSFIAMIM